MAGAPRNLSEAWESRALSQAGFVIEEVREPRPRGPVAAGSRLERALTFPFFVHLRCRLRG